jgi:hypothetical protein
LRRRGGRCGNSESAVDRLTGRMVSDAVLVQVEGAKHLEKTRREIAKKLEKEQEARAAKDEELRQANAELEAAQKKVWAAQQAKRKQASHALALEVKSCWFEFEPHKG